MYADVCRSTVTYCRCGFQHGVFHLQLHQLQLRVRQQVLHWGCPHVSCLAEGKTGTALLQARAQPDELSPLDLSCWPGCCFRYRRTGTCSGTTNGYQCELIPNANCQSNQYRYGSNPGSCYTCKNINCNSGYRRTGTCSGTTNGYQCELIPNVNCQSNQYRDGSNPGTCRSCSHQSCSSNNFRAGSCSGTTNGYSCKACSFLTCKLEQYRSGTCSGTNNGFKCNPRNTCSSSEYLKGYSDTSSGACTSCTTCRSGEYLDNAGGSCGGTHLVAIGSGSSAKTVTVQGKGPLSCPPRVDFQNWYTGDTYPDWFQIGVSGNEVTATRKDCIGCGWGMGLKFKCYVGDGGICRACKNINCLSNQYRTGSCSGTNNGFTCKACSFMTCGLNQYRSGTCSDTNNGFRCNTCGQTSCGQDQYRSGSCSGTNNGFKCEPCRNTQCSTGTRREGSCSGTNNGYSCESIDNAECAANEYRVGSNPGTCTKQPSCVSEQYLRGSSPTDKGTCAPCTNAVCTDKDTYRVGNCSGVSDDYTCLGCANAVCASNEFRSGVCGSAESPEQNGFQCITKTTTTATSTTTTVTTKTTVTTTSTTTITTTTTHIIREPDGEDFVKLISTTKRCANGNWDDMARHAADLGNGKWDYMDCQRMLQEDPKCSTEFFGLTKSNGHCWCVQAGDKCSERETSADWYGTYQVKTTVKAYTTIKCDDLTGGDECVGMTVTTATSPTIPTPTPTTTNEALAIIPTPAPTLVASGVSNNTATSTRSWNPCEASAYDAKVDRPRNGKYTAVAKFGECVGGTELFESGPKSKSRQTAADCQAKCDTYADCVGVAWWLDMNCRLYTACARIRCVDGYNNIVYRKQGNTTNEIAEVETEALLPTIFTSTTVAASSATTGDGKDTVIIVLVVIVLLVAVFAAVVFVTMRFRSGSAGSVTSNTIVVSSNFTSGHSVRSSAPDGFGYGIPHSNGGDDEFYENDTGNTVDETYCNSGYIDPDDFCTDDFSYGPNNHAMHILGALTRDEAEQVLKVRAKVHVGTLHAIMPTWCAFVALYVCATVWV